MSTQCSFAEIACSWTKCSKNNYIKVKFISKIIIHVSLLHVFAFYKHSKTIDWCKRPCKYVFFVLQKLLTLVLSFYLNNHTKVQNKIIIVSNILRNHWTATSFRCIQLNPVQEIRQSGARDHQPSTVPRVMATCVFQAKTSQNS